MSGSAIRRRAVTGAAAAGVLVLALMPSGAAQAAPPSTASAATCKVTGFTPSKVVMGSVTVKKTFSVTTSGCSTSGPWGILLFPYNSAPNIGQTISLNDFNNSASFNPKTFNNADAGKNTAQVFSGDAKKVTLPFTVARAAGLGRLTATPASVRKSKKITFKATLKRINFTWRASKKMPYTGYAGAPVVLQFKATGASTFKTVKTVKTASAGKFTTTVTAGKSGTYRLSYAGNSTTGSAVSTAKAVTVK